MKYLALVSSAAYLLTSVSASAAPHPHPHLNSSRPALHHYTPHHEPSVPVPRARHGHGHRHNGTVTKHEKREEEDGQDAPAFADWIGGVCAEIGQHQTAIHDLLLTVQSNASLASDPAFVLSISHGVRGWKRRVDRLPSRSILEAKVFHSRGSDTRQEQHVKARKDVEVALTTGLGHIKNTLIDVNSLVLNVPDVRLTVGPLIADVRVHLHHLFWVEGHPHRRHPHHGHAGPHRLQRGHHHRHGKKGVKNGGYRPRHRRPNRVPIKHHHHRKSAKCEATRTITKKHRPTPVRDFGHKHPHPRVAQPTPTSLPTHRREPAFGAATATAPRRARPTSTAKPDNGGFPILELNVCLYVEELREYCPL